MSIISTTNVNELPDKLLALFTLSVIIHPEVMLMYSTKEAAERLGLSHDHVRLLARKGVIQAKKLGHDWIVLELNYKRKRKPKGGITMNRQSSVQIGLRY